MPKPGVTLGRADGEVHVTHSQPRMATPLVVGGRAAPVLDEEQPQVLLGRTQVPARVDRPQLGIGRDLLVEAVDEAAEGGLSADCLVKARGLRLAHRFQGSRRRVLRPGESRLRRGERPASPPTARWSG